MGSVSRSAAVHHEGGTAGSAKARHDPFSAIAVPAASLLDLSDGPAALWSDDRSQCVFNAAMAATVGYRDRELCADPALWLSRIEPRDCDRFRAFCENAARDGGPITCHYRFLPARSLQGLDLEERAVRIAPAGALPVILSRYSVSAQSEWRTLAHRVGNHLQAIRGELDLLRLSGRVPDASAQTISRAIDAVHELVQQIRKHLS